MRSKEFIKMESVLRCIRENERFRLKHFHKGTVACAHFYKGAAEVKAG